MPSGGKRAGAGRKYPTKVESFAPDQVVQALRARLDAKPPKMLSQVHGRQLLALIEMWQAALDQLIAAARHALPDVVNDDAAVALECRIEEAAQALRAYRAEEARITPLNNAPDLAGRSGAL